MKYEAKKQEKKEKKQARKEMLGKTSGTFGKETTKKRCAEKKKEREAVVEAMDEREFKNVVEKVVRDAKKVEWNRDGWYRL